jgi:2-amino-4-hydroxy-6-hydroxymethyldihydropteridine diphosphokinase
MEVVLGLGGNVGEPPAAFAQALAKLAEGHAVIAVSALYRSRPVGPPQVDFWNMAARISTTLAPLSLLELCGRIEAAAGRRRDGEIRWGPRPLDIDLLIAAGLVHRGPRLALPHREFHQRAFALVPAADVAPGWVHPYLGQTLAELAADVLRSHPDAVQLVSDTPPVRA